MAQQEEGVVVEGHVKQGQRREQGLGQNEG